MPYAPQVALLKPQVGHGREVLLAARERPDARTRVELVILVTLLILNLPIAVTDSRVVITVYAAVIGEDRLELGGLLL